MHPLPPRSVADPGLRPRRRPRSWHWKTSCLTLVGNGVPWRGWQPLARRGRPIWRDRKKKKKTRARRGGRAPSQAPPLRAPPARLRPHTHPHSRPNGLRRSSPMDDGGGQARRARAPGARGPAAGGGRRRLLEGWSAPALPAAAPGQAFLLLLSLRAPAPPRHYHRHYHPAWSPHKGSLESPFPGHAPPLPPHLS